MGRLQVASGVFQIFMLTEREAFLKEPYVHAQRALMLADILLAADGLTGPQSPSMGGYLDGSKDIDSDTDIATYQLNIASQNLCSANGQDPKCASNS